MEDNDFEAGELVEFEDGDGATQVGTYQPLHRPLPGHAAFAVRVKVLGEAPGEWVERWYYFGEEEGMQSPYDVRPHTTDREVRLATVRLLREQCYALDTAAANGSVIRTDEGPLIEYLLNQDIDTLADWVNLEVPVLENFARMTAIARQELAAEHDQVGAVQ